MKNLQAVLVLLAVTAVNAGAHPGSGIVVDNQGQVYFVDTGAGVWKLDREGKLILISKVAYHFMTLDQKGHFANARLGELDREAFERITPAGSVPALIIASGYPPAVGRDGALYYVPYRSAGDRELVRVTPNEQRSIFAMLPASGGEKPMQWVNGIAAAADGALYISDDDAIRKIEAQGAVTTFRENIQVADCSDPLPETPKLPYLRGLALAADGTVYAAANGCRAVIAIRGNDPIKIVLKAERPWSPTGVAVFRKDLFVLEYLHKPTKDRRDWVPRVRKVAADGTVTTVASIER